jgi:heme exporter protein B
MTGFAGQVREVFRRELLMAWRGKARIVGIAFFAVAVLLLFAVGGEASGARLGKSAGAYFLLAELLASTLLFGQMFRVETEDEALEMLMMLPISPRALFYGKALAATVLLSGLAMVLAPVGLVLFSVSLVESVGSLVLVSLLVVLGLAAPGTLYSALTARAPAQEIVLPLLYFPLLLPALLAGSRALTLVLTGDVMTQVPSWCYLLACFDLLYWVVCGLLFGRVVEGV